MGVGLCVSNPAARLIQCRCDPVFAQIDNWRRYVKKAASVLSAFMRLLDNKIDCA